MLPAFGFVLITNPSATVSLSFDSMVYLNPNFSSSFIAFSVSLPTTLGTITSFTSLVDDSQNIPAIISRNSTIPVNSSITVFLFLGVSKISSSILSSFFSVYSTFGFSILFFSFSLLLVQNHLYHFQDIQMLLF